jgi:exodeoxyribonuclease-5
VLRERGIDAGTIHALIYVPAKNGCTIRYCKRRHLDGVGTIIVDEASMIDYAMHQDILSFGIPTLFVGDHGQLEPIGTNPNLMKNPDVRLVTIHRQALENPILRLATAFREGRPVPYWSDKHGRLDVVRKRDFNDLLTPDTQVICGFNHTRHRVNATIRRMLGFHGVAVCPGDRLICLRNNRRLNLFNGQQVTVEEVGPAGRRTCIVTVRTDDGRVFAAECLTEQFGRELVTDFRSKDILLMDYGYCLTVHKAQGAEWDQVIVLEEIVRSSDPSRWRYTAATRAKKRLAYCF